MQMRRTVLAVILGILSAWNGAGVMANDDLPRTFIGCVAEGGIVRAVDEDITCRVILASDFRVYGTATDECGEDVEIEIWGESRIGVVTYYFAPGRTVVLPEVGMHDAWTSAGATAIPCTRD